MEKINTMLIQELKVQMEIIRRASATVDAIILKLESCNAIPDVSASSKRKTEDELIPESVKKQCTPLNPSVIQQPVGLPLNVLTSTSNVLDPNPMDVTPQFEGMESFEFSAVLPMKKIFVSRLPVAITEDVVKRHIVKRLPACSDSLRISILPGKRYADYSSAIISVGRDEVSFQMINRSEFWPPETVVHQHRANKPKHGFRSQRRNTGRRH